MSGIGGGRPQANPSQPHRPPRSSHGLASQQRCTKHSSRVPTTPKPSTSHASRTSVVMSTVLAPNVASTQRRPAARRALQQEAATQTSPQPAHAWWGSAGAAPAATGRGPQHQRSPGKGRARPRQRQGAARSIRSGPWGPGSATAEHPHRRRRRGRAWVGGNGGGRRGEVGGADADGLRFLGAATGRRRRAPEDGNGGRRSAWEGRR